MLMQAALKRICKDDCLRRMMKSTLWLVFIAMPRVENWKLQSEKASTRLNSFWRVLNFSRAERKYRNKFATTRKVRCTPTVFNAKLSLVKGESVYANLSFTRFKCRAKAPQPFPQFIVDTFAAGLITDSLLAFFVRTCNVRRRSVG